MMETIAFHITEGQIYFQFFRTPGLAQSFLERCKQPLGSYEIEEDHFVSFYRMRDLTNNELKMSLEEMIMITNKLEDKKDRVDDKLREYAVAFFNLHLAMNDSIDEIINL